MQVNKKNWTVQLGVRNKGKDLDREIRVKSFQSRLSKILDAYKAGDNGEIQMPLAVRGKFIDTHVLSVQDLDDTSGRILSDMSDGTIERIDPTSIDEYNNGSNLRVIVEFDVDSGNIEHYSGTTSMHNFDASFREGELQQIVSTQADGTYREVFQFSEDGKTVTFSSEERVEDGEEAKVDSEWFLSLA